MDAYATSSKLLTGTNPSAVDNRLEAVGAKDDLALALYKLAMGQRESFKKMVDLAEKSLQRSSCQVFGVSDGMSEVDLAVQQSINQLRATPFDTLAKSYNEPNMRRLYMFAFEVCLTNEAIDMTRNFIEF